MPITALPEAPATSDPATFASKADALLAALPGFVSETNAVAVAMNLNSTTDTSASSVAIGTGAKSFTVSTGKSFQPGMWLVIADTAAPSTNSMFGQITSYDVATGALVMSIAAVKGSGTKTAWVISQSSAGGAASGANSDITSLTALTSINILPGYLFGCTMSTAGSSATMSIAAGRATDSAGLQSMALTAIAKTTSAWALGTAAGGLDLGTIENSKWYAFYVIRRPDTGVVDALLSLAPGTSSTATMTIASPAVVTWAAHGLQAGAPVKFSTTGALPTGVVAGTTYYVISAGLATDSFRIAATQGGAAINTTGSQSGVHTATSVPTLPANYTQHRRIGFGLTNGSGQWISFVQDGDVFQWATLVPDISALNPGVAAVSRTLTVPLGVRVVANLQVVTQNVAAGVPVRTYISDLAITDVAPSNALTDSGESFLGAGGVRYSGARVNVRTNTSQQVRSRLDNSDANTTLVINTLGWTDSRGRDA